MEDALAHYLRPSYSLSLRSLNPCFNGRCTRTERRWCPGMSPAEVVLILVLMEDALAHYLLSNFQIKEASLNPCFNGRCTRTAKLG